MKGHWTVVCLLTALLMPPDSMAQSKKELGKVIEPDKQSAEASRRIMALHELESIQSELEDPGRLIDRLRLDGRESELQDYRDSLLKRRRELQEFLGDRQTELRKRRIASPPSQDAKQAMLGGLLRSLVADETPAGTGMSLYPGSIQTVPLILKQQQQQPASCRFIWLGEARARDMRLYPWWTDAPPTGTIAFWPLSDPLSSPWDDPPTKTVTEGWEDEVGARFFGFLRGKNDGLTTMAHALVLEFPFPAPPCDATMCWFSTARVVSPGRWNISGWPAHATTEWMVNESPFGETFPRSVYSYDWIWEGIGWDTASKDVYQNVETTLDGCFDVKANLSPKVHLGLSLWLLEKQGSVTNLRNPPYDWFSFEHVYYIMAGKDP